MKVPLLDLKAQWRTIEREVMRSIRDVCRSQSFILGPYVERFEEEVEEYLNVKHAVGVASGTDALLLCMMALGIGPGDRVITTPFTFFATAGSIFRLGSTPVFIDIHPKTFNIDPDMIEKYLRNNSSKNRIRAIIPVHLFGQCAGMDEIMDIAQKYNLWVIEDAAQAFGTEYLSGDGENRRPEKKKYRILKAGTIGHMGCFSFFPSKNLGGFGDGGMVVTNDSTLADKIRLLRVHGGQTKYRHRVVGINSRLDALQAEILRVKLRYLKKWIEKRIKNARNYERLFLKTSLIKDGNIILPEIVQEKSAQQLKPKALEFNRANYFFHIFNQYVIRATKRDKLRNFLKQKGIETEIYYPIPLHLQECFKSLGYRKGDLPEAERASQEVLAIPVYPELTRAQQAYVVEEIESFYKL